MQEGPARIDKQQEKALKAEYRQSQIPGADLGHGFNFSSQPGAHGNSLLCHHISKKKNTEFPV
jgi:hypothetical protein